LLTYQFTNVPRETIQTKGLIMKNSINNSASNAVLKILEAFENGNLPKAIAFSTFNPPSNIPAYRWTQRNRALAFLQNTGDARGFNQWKEAGRFVKKGAKSIYILGPVLKKSNKVEIVKDPITGEEKEEQQTYCAGYYGIPVFRVEDTEGEPLEYINLDVQELPLIDVAKKWNLEVKIGAFNGNYYGYYSNHDKEIVLATNEEYVFLHELAHAAHYRIDQEARNLATWEKEIIADLSAAALLYMVGKEAKLGNHYNYIKHYAEEAGLDIFKACMKLLDVCLDVITAITQEAKAEEIKEVV
jgi:hypothetical protein